MKTDIQIAQEAQMAHIRDVAKTAGIEEEELEFYGKYKAKLSEELWNRVKEEPDGKLVLVTAINPTPAGEGKTTITAVSYTHLKNGEARIVPIYQSTTFKYNSSEQMGRLFDLEESGYFYTRLQNPTNDAVAAKICDLEGGVAAMLTSSGQAANFYAIMNIVQAGDHIVCASALYGGTYNPVSYTHLV